MKKKKVSLVIAFLAGLLLSVCPVCAQEVPESNAEQIQNDGVEITKVTFPDEALYEYVTETVDKNQDNILTEDEAEKVTEIDMVYEKERNPKDLSVGLEYFPHLQYLYVGVSDLSQIDVTKNPELIRLELNNTLIEAVDVSHNPKLFALNLDDSKLKSLDVSHNPELYEVYVSNTGVTELDVSHNPDLTHIRVSGTQITNLDVTHNPKLAAIYFNNTKIKSLDLSKNPKMFEIFCYGSEIGELDLTMFPELNSIECYDTPIRKLNVSKCPKLSGLTCNNTQITELDVTKNPKLSRLECAGTAIRKLDLSKNSELRILNISDTNISNLKTLDMRGRSKIEEIICSNAGVENILLDKGNLLASLVCDNNHLTSLDLSGTSKLWYLKNISPQSRTIASRKIYGERVLELNRLSSTPDKILIQPGDGYHVDRGRRYIVLEKSGEVELSYTYQHGYRYDGLEPMEVNLKIVEGDGSDDVVETPVLKLNVSGTLPMKKGSACKKVNVTKILKNDRISKWSSSNSKIVSVSSKGVLKAKKTGKATITAVTAKGAKASFKVKVQTGKVKLKKLTVKPKTSVLKKGQKKTLKTDIVPISATDKVRFTSSNKKVASVSSKGVIKAKKKGRATITVKAGKKTVKVKVQVK